MYKGKIMKEIISNRVLTGERPLFMSRDIIVRDVQFGEGESPLKESSNIEVSGSVFGWKYPLWYCRNVNVCNTKWEQMARAGVWYSDDISVKDCHLDAPKNFRRCRRLKIENVRFTDAAETLWDCHEVDLKNIVIERGDYFGMNSTDVTVDGMTITGNYAFDGARNITVENSNMICKDTFWNCENVVVRNTHISGEYIGWNSRNLVFENCTIESLQGLCYIKGLTMKNCRLINTTLAFEYSEDIKAEINSSIDSVMNPSSGEIIADSIGELIMDGDKIDPGKTKIICKE